MSRISIVTTIIAACIPMAAASQSATDDADLFPEDKRVLRFGASDRHVTLAPFIQYDLGAVNDDPDGRGAGGGQLRLARLYAFGQARNVSATLAYNFDNDVFPLAYAFAAYELTDRWTIRAGQQDEPFSLQDMSGSRFLPFAEAGLNAAITPGDNVGLAALYSGDRRSFAVGIFGGDFNSGLGDEGIALTGRATFAPVYEEDRIERGGDAASTGIGTQRVVRLVHVGLGASIRRNLDDPVSFSGGGGSVLIDTALATSPVLTDVDQISRINAELAVVRGPASLQAEVSGALIEAQDADGFVHGGYLYGTYFLTGERRGYDPFSGSFGRVVPRHAVDDGGFGAYEIGARIAWLDLTDLGRDAGAQVQVSLVANAYLTKRLTATLDLTQTRITAGIDTGEKTTALTLRGQIAF